MSYWLRTASNTGNFDWKATLWQKQPTNDYNDKTEQRRESRSKKTKGDEWMFGPKSSRTLIVACRSLESIECLACVLICFCCCCCFFFSLFRLRYTRLALNYLFGLKREGTVMRRDSGLIHPHYAGREPWKYSAVRSTPEQRRRAVFKCV